MSVGATTLAAVTADRAVTRSPMLTLYPDRPSQVGFPGDNVSSPGNGSAESGLVITDFVGRVGDPDPVVAADGSARPGAQLLADALHALAHLATGGDPLPSAVAVAYPAGWPAAAVTALRDALGRVPQWSDNEVTLISDVAAALTALQANPGLPDSGILAVCDFGGSGTDITLVDAGRGNRTVGVTVRHTGFCGQVIDQLLLDHVVAELGAGGSGDGAPGIGSLARLRSQCGSVKEQLSTDTVAELPGFHGGVWITRVELDEAIRRPRDGFLTALQKVLDDNQISGSQLSAVVSVGGVAGIPAVNGGLAERFGVPVISAPRPHLTAAIGAALAVAGDEVLAAAEPVAPVTPDRPAEPAEPVEPESESVEAELEPESESVEPEPDSELPLVEPIAPLDVLRPPVSDQGLALADLTAEPAISDEPAAPARDADLGVAEPAVSTWFRRPVPVILGAALAALVLGIVAVIALRHAADHVPESPLTTIESTTTTDGTVPPTPKPRPLPGLGPVFPETSTVPPGLQIAPPAPEISETGVAP